MRISGSRSRYPTLYLADPHVSSRATAAIAAWVRRGGSLYATASAGVLNELNAPNRPMQALLGLDKFAAPAGDPPCAAIFFLSWTPSAYNI